MVTGNGVAGADDEDAAEERSVDGVAGNTDIPRLHIRIAVVHDNAVVAERIFGNFVFIAAEVPGDRAVVKAVEVDAFAVDFFEEIVGVVAGVDVAGRIDGDGEGPGFEIDLGGGVADQAAAVVLYLDGGGVADLDGVARGLREVVIGDEAAGVAFGRIKRVRPDAVATHVDDAALGDFKIRSAFFQ